MLRRAGDFAVCSVELSMSQGGVSSGPSALHLAKLGGAGCVFLHLTAGEVAGVAIHGLLHPSGVHVLAYLSPVHAFTVIWWVGRTRARSDALQRPMDANAAPPLLGLGHVAPSRST